jgi:hypothetical protein
MGRSKFGTWVTVEHAADIIVEYQQRLAAIEARLTFVPSPEQWQETNSQLRAAREQLAAAEARCTELSRVDWYWDDCHLECAIPVDEAGENNSTGDILELRPVHEMPKVWMLITDDGWKCFDTLEKAEREQEVVNELPR